MSIDRRIALSLGMLALLCSSPLLIAYEISPFVRSPDVVKIGTDANGKTEVCQKEPGKLKCKGDGACQQVGDECHSCDTGFLYQEGLGCYKCETGQSLINKNGSWTCTDGK
jgi:hypothetical protein